MTAARSSFCSALGVLLTALPCIRAQNLSNHTLLPNGTAESESAAASPSFAAPVSLVAEAVASQRGDRQRITIAVAVTLAAVVLLCIGVVLFLKRVAGSRNRSQTSPPLPTTAMPAHVLAGLQFDERVLYRHVAATKIG